MSNHTPITPRGYVYRQGAADLLGVGLSTFYRLVKAGEVQVYHTGKGWPCYKIRELERLSRRRARATKG